MYFVIIFFIYYKNNHKCNIGIIINLIIFVVLKWKKYKFSQKFKRQVNENIYIYIYFIKVIYDILWIIKKNINLEIILLVLNKLSQTYFFYLQSKTLKKVTKRINKI